MPDSWVFWVLCFVFLSRTYTKCKQYTTNIEQQRTIKTDFYYTHSMRCLVGCFFRRSVCCFKCKSKRTHTRICESVCFFLRAQSLFSHFYFSSLCEIEFIFAYILIYVWHCPYKVSECVCACIVYATLYICTHSHTIQQWTMASIKPSILILIPYFAFLPLEMKDENLSYFSPYLPLLPLTYIHLSASS